MLITVSIQLAECIRFYRNFERVIKRTNIIVIGIIESMVLLLAIMGRLEIIELLVAVVGNITSVSYTHLDFTDNGHFMVITGYDDEGFTINDPHSIIKSNTHWQFERLG